MQKENIDSRLSSKQKGEISENRVAEIITLSSAGHLSCFKPIADDDGLDLIVCKKGEFNPIFLQIKSRFKTQRNGRYIHNVGFNTFTPDARFYVLFMLLDELELEVKAIWLVPSLEFEKLATSLVGEGYKSVYRINANPNKETAQDRWAPYLTDKKDLVERIYAAMDGTKITQQISMD